MNVPNIPGHRVAVGGRVEALNKKAHKQMLRKYSTKLFHPRPMQTPAVLGVKDSGKIQKEKERKLESKVVEMKKVEGKRGKSHSNDKKEKKKHKRHKEDKATRIMKYFDDQLKQSKDPNQPPSIEGWASLAPHKRAYKRPSLAPIEKLPDEVIQKICLFSLNPDLPLASEKIGKQLSNEPFYLAFCAAVFYHQPKLHEYATYKPQWIPEQVALQTRVLKCRWLTWDVYQKYAYCAHARYNMYLRAENMKKSERMQWKPNFGRYDDCHLDEWYMEVARGCRIPQKLLRGPWTDDKIDFLHYLENIGAWVDDSNDRQLAMEDAISAGEHDVVELLLRKNIGVVPTTELLRSAIMNKNGCSTRVVTRICAAALLRQDKFGIHSIDWKDKQLWTWADHHHQGPQDIGWWVKMQLRKAAEHEKPSSSQIVGRFC
ncbi:hypothetical protein LTR39_001349 [Cryomyces antarcticus]|nr:hypothetical protein LTR39_001349 [Cryomyces antarcticus]